MNGLQTALREVNQEIGVVTKLRDMELDALAKAKSSLEVAIRALNGGPEPVRVGLVPRDQRQSAGTSIAPAPSTTIPLSQHVLTVLQDGTPRPVREIAERCVLNGWRTKGANPLQLVGWQLRKFHDDGVLRRSGKSKHFLYRYAKG